MLHYKHPFHNLSKILLAIAFSLSLVVDGRPQNAVTQESGCQSQVALSLKACGLDSCDTPVALFSGDTKVRHQDFAPGQTHCYQLEVTEDRQFIRIWVDQHNIDVVTTVCGPDHKPITRIDSSSGTSGREPVTFIANARGTYSIVIEAPGANTPPGSVDVTLADRRPAEPPDEVRIKAERAFFAADVFRVEEGDVSQQCAADSFRTALELYQQLNDERGEAQTRNLLGFSLAKLHRLSEALKFLLPAPEIWVKLRDPYGQAEALNNIGFSYAGLGEAELALKAYEAALPLWPAARKNTTDAQKLADIDTSEGYTLTNLAEYYNDLGDSDRALQSFIDLLPLSRRSQVQIDYANNLKNIGLVYNAKQDYKQARVYFWEANRQLPQNQDTNVLGLKAAILNSIGAMNVRLGDEAQGFRDFDEALKLYKQLNYQLGDAIIANSYGKAYYMKGGDADKRTAVAYYLKALNVLDAMEDPAHTASTLYNLAQVQRDLGLFPEARASIEEAINYVETVRAKVGSSELKSLFFSERYFYYQLYIELLMDMHTAQPSDGYDKLSLQVSERARARRLLDLLNKAHVGDSGERPVVPERVVTAQTMFTDALKRRRQVVSGPHTPAQTQEIENLVRSREESYRNLQREIRYTDVASLLQPYPLSFDEIRRLLDTETMILEYEVGEKKGFLWAVSSDIKKPLITKELPGRAEIESMVKEFRRALTAPGCRIKHEATDERRTRLEVAQQAYVSAAKQLGDMLLGSTIASQLGKNRLVIIADGPLQLIPFGAITASGSSNVARGEKDIREGVAPLVIAHEIIYLPSLTSLDEMRQVISGRVRGPKSLLAFADPVFSSDDERAKNLGPNLAGRSNALNLSQNAELDLMGKFTRGPECDQGDYLARLPGTLQEARNIIALVPDRTRQKLADSFDANMATLMSPAARDYSILHLATHAFVPPQAPERATIVLSLIDSRGQPQQGLVRLKDISQLKLRADLVTLSACETSIGKDIKGEGLVGLARGFMYAGVPRVVASLWKVDDEATAELMSKFYLAMLVDDLPAAAALRRAKIDMYEHPKKPEWSLPFYWAGFTLQGEWR